MDRARPPVAAARLKGKAFYYISKLSHSLLWCRLTESVSESASVSLLKLRAKVKDFTGGIKFSTASTGSSKLRV